MSGSPKQITVYSTFRMPSFIPPAREAHAYIGLEFSGVPFTRLATLLMVKRSLLSPPEELPVGLGGTDCGVAVCAAEAACGL